MMQETEAKRILEEAFETQLRTAGETDVDPQWAQNNPAIKSYCKCRMSGKSVSVKAKKTLCETAWEKLRGLCTECVLKERDHMVLLVGSGFQNRNPAAVELCFREDALEISAWAKEGLINQRTAEKAVKACLSALELA